MSADLIEVVCGDDEPLALSRLVRCLGVVGGVRVNGTLRNGDEFAARTSEANPDAYFLDIRMPGANVFATLQGIELQRRPLVVFVTAYDDFAVRAFEVDAIDYLLKPVEVERLAEAVRRIRGREVRPLGDAALGGLLARERRGTVLTRLLVESNGVQRAIPVATVENFEAARNYVRLHLVHGGRALIRRPLARLEEGLDPDQFVRVHRSAIVNLDLVRQVQPWFSGDAVLVMASGAKQRLSRRFRDRFYRAFTGQR